VEVKQLVLGSAATVRAALVKSSLRLRLIPRHFLNTNRKEEITSKLDYSI